MGNSGFIAWMERLKFNNKQASIALGLSAMVIARYRGDKLNPKGQKYNIPLYISLACAAIAYGLPAIK